MLAQTFRSIRVFLVLLAIWVIMQESFTLSTIAMGSAMAIVSLLLTRAYILKTSFHSVYRVRLLPTLWYGIRLIASIYGAGFQAVKKMLTGAINVGVVKIRTSLQDDFAIALLGNTITLIPGTVTLDREGNTLSVIWLDRETDDPETAGPLIKGPFEDLIKGITR